jgi:hypothetical protein
VLLLLALAAACGSTDTPTEISGDEATASTTSTTSAAAATSSTSTSTSSPAPPGTAAPGVEVALRVEDRTRTAPELASVVEAALVHPNGWQQAGFHFTFTDDAPHVVVLAEPAEVDELCQPYDTEGQWSCQIGSVVALNAERWRSATTTWTGSLEDYRTMLVNHEVGHLLGQHHVEDRCPTEGAFAPVMAQQSKGLAGCEANPWPLPWEIACAAQHQEPIAPPYEPDASPTCGPS